MTMAAHNYLFLALFSALFLAAQPLPAQEEPPKPAGAMANPIPLGGMGAQQDQNEPIPAMEPDMTPLTGVQAPTLGTPPVLHSYWVPGIQWSGTLQSNSYNQTPNSGWLMNNYIIGNLSFLKDWSRSQLAVNYSGGSFFSTDSTQGNGGYHQLAFSQTFQWNHWSIQLLDQFSYLPQTAFGFGGGTNLGIPGAAGPVAPVIPGMGNTYIPNQSIYAAVGARYSNAATVQITYTVTPRGSITMSGSYGFLNFVESGNVDNDMTTGTIGYNYILTSKDSIGAFYRFSAYHFSGEPLAYGDHSANFAYSRKVTGRIALQIYVGPDFTTSRVSTNGNNLTYGVNSGANLNCGFQNGGFTVGYTHGIAGGSGVLTGSSTDMLNFGANHKLGRIWRGQVNMGYAHNSPVSGSPQTITQSFSTWNAGGGVSRNIGRNTNFAIAYNATITDYGLPGCVGAECSASQTFNYITINFQWQTRPFVLP
jgi:hypothetical protein